MPSSVLSSTDGVDRFRKRPSAGEDRTATNQLRETANERTLQ
jgi:hypothetical protein